MHIYPVSFLHSPRSVGEGLEQEPLDGHRLPSQDRRRWHGQGRAGGGGQDLGNQIVLLKDRKNIKYTHQATSRGEGGGGDGVEGGGGGRHGGRQEGQTGQQDQALGFKGVVEWETPARKK